MKIGRRLSGILCGIGLAFALTALPVAWALSPAQTTEKNVTATTAAQNLVDINTASEAQLKAVPGIGDVYAQRIIKNRPYSSKHQLVTKGIMSQGVYDKVKSHLIAHRAKK